MATLKDTVVLGSLNVTNNFTVGENMSIAQDLSVKGNYVVSGSENYYITNTTWSPLIYSSSEELTGDFANIGDLVIQSGNRFNNNIHFLSSGGLAMLLRYDGNVGIGTNNPEYKLDVIGGVHVTENIVLDGGITVNAVEDGINDVVVGGSLKTAAVAAGGVSSPEDTIDTDGNVRIRDEGQMKMGNFAMQYNPATESLDFNWIGG